MKYFLVERVAHLRNHSLSQLLPKINLTIELNIKIHQKLNVENHQNKLELS